MLCAQTDTQTVAWTFGVWVSDRLTWFTSKRHQTAGELRNVVLQYMIWKR